MTEQAKLISQFKEYIARFDQLIGKKEFGDYGTWNQFVIKKLTFDEFIAKYEEYVNLEQLYAGILDRGETVNDAIFRALQEAGANILLEVN